MLIGWRHTSQIDQHAREPLRVGDRVAQQRPIGAAGVGADHERVALQRSGRPGRRRERREDAEQA